MTLIGLIQRSYKHYKPSIKSPLLISSSSPLSSSSSSSLSFSAPSLFFSHPSNLRTAILSTTLTFVILFSILHQKPEYNLYDVIDYSSLKKDVENTNTIQYLTYKSPFDDNLFKEHSRKNNTVWKFSSLGLLKSQESVAYDGKVCQRSKNQAVRYKSIWKRLKDGVSSKGLWHEGKEVGVDEALTALKTACILHVDWVNSTRFHRVNHVNNGGVDGDDVGWMVTMEGGQQAILNIVWEAKGEMKRGGLCEEGFGMPTSEIAAFHVHRLLGMNKVSLVAGRRLNVLHDVLPYATASIANLIRVKQGLSGNETCVVGRCRSCWSQHLICPSNNQIEVSLTLDTLHSSTPIKSWQPATDLAYQDRCNGTSLETNIHRHLDVFDLSIFNTLIGKKSSVSLSLLSVRRSEEVLVSFDNSRSFCDYNKELDLTPLINCCKLRKSTYDKLKNLKKEGFSKELRQSLLGDDLSPVLKSQWYSVLDDRLNNIISALDKCISNNGARNIFV